MRTVLDQTLLVSPRACCACIEAITALPNDFQDEGSAGLGMFYCLIACLARKNQGECYWGRSQGRGNAQRRHRRQRFRKSDDRARYLVASGSQTIWPASPFFLRLTSLRGHRERLIKLSRIFACQPPLHRAEQRQNLRKKAEDVFAKHCRGA
jgi:hypothetical protein